MKAEWSRDEDNLLRARYGVSSTEQLAEELGKSESSIRRRAITLGLSVSPSGRNVAQTRGERLRRAASFARRHGCLTSGMVATICGVSTRTVMKWSKVGAIKYFTLIGSKDRRFRVEEVRRFLAENGMGQMGRDAGILGRVIIVSGLCPVLAMGLAKEIPEEWLVQEKAELVEVAACPPADVLVLGVLHGPSSKIRLIRTLRNREDSSKIVVVLGEDDGDGKAYLEAGCSIVLPFDCKTDSLVDTCIAGR